jgi:hypothetical protein
MPAKYRIGDIQTSSFDGWRPASATISIDDGNGYFGHLPYNQIAIEADAYLKEIVNFVNSHPQATSEH